MKRSVIILVILMLIGGLGWSLFQRINQAPSQGFQRGGEKPPVTVEVVSIQTQMMQDIRTLTGTAFPQSEFTLSSRTGGRLEWFRVEEGNQVSRGQLLGQIDDALYQQEINQIQADLQVIYASMDEVLIQQRLAEQELDRAITLHHQKMLSEAELENARAELERTHARLRVIEAQIKQKEENIRQIRINLQDTRIQAQWPGSLRYYTVSKRHVQAGTTLSPGTQLVTLIDLSTIRGRLKTPEADYAKLQMGQSAKIYLQAQPKTPFEGKIIRKLPNLDPQTRSGEIEVQIHNPGGLIKPGMFLKADLILSTQPQARTVPNQAILKQGEKEGVFVVNPDGESVRFVPIQVGLRNAEVTEILSPKISEKIVTRGNHLLKEGDKIVLPGQKPPGKGEPGEGQGSRDKNQVPAQQKRPQAGAPS